MGYSRELSWSSTRAKALRDCPRGAWFKYHVSGEPDYAARARTLDKLVTLPIAAGNAVEYVIARALRAYRDEGEVVGGLAQVGVQMLRHQLKASAAVAGGIRQGDDWKETKQAWLPPFQHHVYGYDVGWRREGAMEDRVVQCLEAFERSEVWERLKGSTAAKWHGLTKLGESSVPNFVTKSGLKVWASIDFAMEDDEGVVVLDWKTGRETPQALNDAQLQLAVYAIWARGRYGVLPEQVRVQAVWLQGDTTWRPMRVERADLEATARRIKEEVAAEESLLAAQRNVRGQVLRYYARIEDFPPRASSQGCLPCRFRELCPEGQEACGHV